MSRRCVLRRCFWAVFAGGLPLAAGPGGWSAQAGEAASPPAQVAQQIDRLLASETAAQAPTSQPAPPASDEVFLRRVYLDLVGQPPQPDDVLAFAFDRDPHRRQAVTRKLLAQPQFGQNWARYWRDVIYYRRSEERAQIAAPAAEAFLAAEFNRNTPWDQLAAKFFTAEGGVQENGAAAVIWAQQGRPEETAAELSRIFLGVQIQCAQCHDHPTDRWKREQFHQLAAFFPRVAVRRDRNPQMIRFEVVGEDRLPDKETNFNGNRVRGTLEHRMPDLDDPEAPGVKTQPVFFVTGQKLDFGASDDERRGTLARWATAPSNAWFAKAFVNRLWGELVGEGFYEPLDDMGPDRAATAPKVLDYLAQEFVRSGHDVKWLFATVVGTAAYQRESRARRVATGTAFAANCNQRLRADQLFDALLAALDVSNPEDLARGQTTERAYDLMNKRRARFNQVFGYDPSDPRDEVTGTIPQALSLMNSPLVHGALLANRRDAGLGKLLAQTPDDAQVVGELYLRSLSRQPTRQEVETCLAYVKQVGDRGEAFEDLLWSLINSTEFLHRR